MGKKKQRLVPSYPVALAYQQAADRLLDSYGETSVPAGPTALPLLFLYSHAIELYLKEYLRLTLNLTTGDFGHNLGKLWDAAVNAGIPISGEERTFVERLIEGLATGHSDFQFRYQDQLHTSFLHAGPKLARLGTRIIAAVVKEPWERYIVEQRRPPEGASTMVDVPIRMVGYFDS